MSLLEIVWLILFVVSGGLLFNERFRKNWFAVGVAAALAIAGTYYLTEQIVRDVIKRERATQVPSASGGPSDKNTSTTAPSAPSYLSRRRAYTNLRTEPLEWGRAMFIDRGLAVTFSRLSQRTGDQRNYHEYDQTAMITLPLKPEPGRGTDLAIYYSSPKRFNSGPEVMIVLFDTKNAIWRPVLYTPASKVELGATYTNGMRDIVLDSRYVYTWGGDGYYTVLVDGTLSPVALPEEWRTPPSPSTNVETTAVPTLAKRRQLQDEEYRSISELPEPIVESIISSYNRKDCGGADDQGSMFPWNFSEKRFYQDNSHSNVFAWVRLDARPCQGSDCADGLVLRWKECATSVIACSFNIIRKEGGNYRLVGVGQGFSASILPTQRNGMYDVDLGYSVWSWDGSCYRPSSGP